MANRIVEKKFIIEASLNRVWDVLGQVIYQCLPLERTDIVNESTICGLLRMKLGFVSLRLPVKVVLVDVSPPRLLDSVVSVKLGIIQLDLKTTFGLTSNGGNRTQVVCTASEEKKGSGGILRPVLLRKGQIFAGDLFHEIEQRLQLLC